MKKLLMVFVSAIVFTSCIGSNFVGIEGTALNDDTALEGTWVFVPITEQDKKNEMGLLPTKIILKKGAMKGEYSLEMVQKAHENGKKAPNTKLRAYVGKVKTVSIFSFGEFNKKQKKEIFFNGMYAIEGSKLTLRILVEEEVTKAKKENRNINSNMKPTTFITQKALQDFIKKNITDLKYLSDELTFTKEQ